MSKSLIDRKGVVHEKGWDGTYRPKQGVFAPQKDTNFWGAPNVEKDWMGNAKVERDWLGRPDKSSSGQTLYQRKSGYTGNNNSSGDAAIAGLAFAVLLIALIMALAVFLLLIMPLFIMLWRAFSSERGRRDLMIFTVTTLTLTGLVTLSIFALDTITVSYYQTWQKILYPTLAVAGWVGFGWITVVQNWLTLMWTSFINILRGYWLGVVTMWDWVWSKF